MKQIKLTEDEVDLLSIAFLEELDNMKDRIDHIQKVLKKLPKKKINPEWLGDKLSLIREEEPKPTKRKPGPKPGTKRKGRGRPKGSTNRVKAGVKSKPDGRSNNKGRVPIYKEPYMRAILTEVEKEGAVTVSQMLDIIAREFNIEEKGQASARRNITRYMNELIEAPYGLMNKRNVEGTRAQAYYLSPQGKEAMKNNLEGVQFV